MSQYRIYVHQKGQLAGARERGIYVDKKGQFYLRKLLANGQEHYQSLGTNQIGVARERRDALLKKQIEAELGIGEDPAKAAKKAKTPVAKVIRRHMEDGYPDKKGNPRKPGKHRDEEAARCEILLEYFNGDAPAEDLDQDGLDAYHTWRCEKIAKGKKKLDGTKSKPKGEGDRATDLDLNCLNSAYRWAKRKKLVRTNPIFDRVRYYCPGEAVHCREYAPVIIIPEPPHKLTFGATGRRRAHPLLHHLPAAAVVVIAGDTHPRSAQYIGCQKSNFLSVQYAE